MRNFQFSKGILERNVRPLIIINFFTNSDPFLYF